MELVILLVFGFVGIGLVAKVTARSRRGNQDAREGLHASDAGSTAQILGIGALLHFYHGRDSISGEAGGGGDYIGDIGSHGVDMGGGGVDAGGGGE